MKLEIPRCDDGIMEKRRRAKLSRGKGIVAGFEDRQNNERGIFFAWTSLASRETWFVAEAVRIGTQQVKLRDDRRELALRGWSCHAYSSKVSRSFNLTASQNRTLTGSHGAFEP